MGKVIYQMSASLDGFAEDANRSTGVSTLGEAVYRQPEVESEYANIYIAMPRYIFSDTLESVAQGVRLARSADSEPVASRLGEEAGKKRCELES